MKGKKSKCLDCGPFRSAAEANRWKALTSLQDIGQISHLRRNPEFKLKNGKKYSPSFRYCAIDKESDLGRHGVQTTWCYEDVRKYTPALGRTIKSVSKQFHQRVTVIDPPSWKKKNVS